MKTSQLLLCTGNCMFVFLVVNSIVNFERTSAGLLDDAKSYAKEAKTKVEDSLNMRVCLMNDNCNDRFFRLDNYCCSATCCNMFQYIFRNDDNWENFKDTIDQPRAINIIIFVIAVLLISSLFSILISLICCFFGCARCCCGSKKYSIVSH